jgi:hypothetical protein
MAIIRSEHARTRRSLTGYNKLLEEAQNEYWEWWNEISFNWSVSNKNFI